MENFTTAEALKDQRNTFHGLSSWWHHIPLYWPACVVCVIFLFLFSCILSLWFSTYVHLLYIYMKVCIYCYYASWTPMDQPHKVIQNRVNSRFLLKPIWKGALCDVTVCQWKVQQGGGGEPFSYFWFNLLLSQFSLIWGHWKNKINVI